MRGSVPDAWLAAVAVAVCPNRRSLRMISFMGKRAALLAGASVGALAFADVSASIAAARDARMAYRRGETINSPIQAVDPEIAAKTPVTLWPTN